MQQVNVSDEAKAIIEQLQAQHGELIFHQSGGCCDGSSPMCFAKDEFFIDDSDILLGTVAGCPFYMASFQYEYWKYTHLTLDVTKGRGASFSLEIPLGLRFVIKSRLLSDEEIKLLEID